MDYNALRLKHHGDPVKLDEILQEECRDKCRQKLPVLTATVGFRFPSLALAEMSTSEAVADVHAGLTGPGERVLDMTLGLGVDAFAMCGRGATVTGIELDPAAYAAACHNAGVLGVADRITIINGDSMEWLEGQEDRVFDTIFIDPQRRDSAGRHFALAQYSPDITGSLSMLMEHCRKLIVKLSPMVDIKGVKRELGLDHCGVLIIGTARECKEVVLVISKDCTKDRVDCVTTDREPLSFESGRDDACPEGYADPKPGMLLLEPFPAVMKGVTLGSLRHIKAPKVAPNTHMFVAGDVDAGLPCKRMRIIEVIPFNKAAIKSFAKSYPIINVATRNFPLTAPELARRLRVREGGDRIIHGVTLAGGEKILVVTKMPM